MTTEISRRDFLKASGSLLVTVGATGGMQAAFVDDALAQATSFASPSPEAFSSWLSIGRDGKILAFSGKVDHGQGLGTAFRQIIAEELDVPLSRVSILFGDTIFTANQGGASGSTGIRAGGKPIRNIAAEARRVLVGAGAARLGVSADAVAVKNGVVFVVAEPTKRVTYEDLVAAGALAGKLTWNKQVGNGMDVVGEAKPKPVSEYKIVGQPALRDDVPAKIMGTEDYVGNVRLPGMLHGRMVRPTVAAATPVKVDEASIRDIKGAKVVWKKDFLGVVAETEWDAIQAARKLKVEWSAPAMNWPGHEGLYDHIRKAAVVASNGQNAFVGKKEFDEGPAQQAFAKAAKVIEADYECAFQSHARMGPSVGVADVKADKVTIYSDTQKPHFHRLGISKLLEIPEDKVHVIWKDGSGSYGRSDADEASFEAAIMSREVGRPVRVQWMRDEGIAWDPKAPAAVVTMKAGLDAAGNVDGWSFRAKGFSGWDVKWIADGPEQTIAGMQLGHKKWNMHNFDTPHESYQFNNKVQFWQTIAPLQEQASPLRSAHLRAPQEFQTRFAQDAFIDEVAAAVGMDPVAFRLKHLTDPREIAVIKAAAEKAGWGPDDAKPRKASGNILRGRGISMMSGYGTFAAVIADIEINRQTGRIWAKRVTVAHDCGLIINPGSLKLVIEANIMQGLSRALFEEVHFDQRRVTSTDWANYPIADIRDAPEAIDVVLIDRKDLPSGGAGEPSLIAVPAAVANAIYNATGQRVRRFPFVASRVKKLLTA
ncbi:MAG: molybdopterin cofactor-binding domain-containing protein [Burkholderiales bacterium]